MSAPVPLARRALAEYVGTAALVAVVVGSGIMAQTLSPDDTGLQLLENSLTTVFGLGVLIVVLGPVSGAHFNPVVTLADAWAGRRTGVDVRAAGAYLAAQTAGAISGAIGANAVFGERLVSWSTHHRSEPHLWLGEVVATAGLIVVIFALVRTGRGPLIPVSVAAYIGAAYWFTSSTSFANPAVTVGRAFSDTFAGIAPASIAGFVAAQLAGAAAGYLLVTTLYPSAAQPVEQDAKRVEQDAEHAAEPVEQHAQCVEQDAERVEQDAERVEQDAKCVEQHAERAAEPVEQDAERAAEPVTAETVNGAATSPA